VVLVQGPESQTIQTNSFNQYDTSIEGKEISRRTLEPKIVNIHERDLEQQERTEPSIQLKSIVAKPFVVNAERAVIKEKIVEKPIDVLIEKPVAKLKEVQVPYNVYIDNPKERIIEKDVVTEIIVQKPIIKYDDSKEEQV